MVFIKDSVRFWARFLMNVYGKTFLENSLHKNIYFLKKKEEYGEMKDFILI